jgi:hypothetical protein
MCEWRSTTGKSRSAEGFRFPNKEPNISYEPMLHLVHDWLLQIKPKSAHTIEFCWLATIGRTLIFALETKMPRPVGLGILLD